MLIFWLCVALFLLFLPLCGLGFWQARRFPPVVRRVLRISVLLAAGIYSSGVTTVLVAANNFVKTTYGPKVPSPNGQMYAQQITSDEGALGGAERVVVGGSAGETTVYTGGWGSVSRIDWETDEQLTLITGDTRYICVETKSVRVTCRP